MKHPYDFDGPPHDPIVDRRSALEGGAAQAGLQIVSRRSAIREMGKALACRLDALDIGEGPARVGGLGKPVVDLVEVRLRRGEIDDLSRHA